MPTLGVIGEGRAGLSLQDALVAAGWAAVPSRHHDDDLTAAGEGCDLLVAAADRPLHHAACAVAANHAVALLGSVERIAASAGLPLAPYAALAAGAVAGVAAGATPAAALTGPVARGDWATVAAHLAALPE